MLSEIRWGGSGGAEHRWPPPSELQLPPTAASPRATCRLLSKAPFICHCTGHRAPAPCSSCLLSQTSDPGLPPFLTMAILCSNSCSVSKAQVSFRFALGLSQDPCHCWVSARGSVSRKTSFLLAKPYSPDNFYNFPPTLWSLTCKEMSALWQRAMTASLLFLLMAFCFNQCPGPVELQS